MTLQLYQVLLDMYADLGHGQVRKVTGTGTTATTIDTAIKTGGLEVGSIIVRSTTDALAPQGEFGRVTAFNPTTSTWAHDALTVATAAGDYVQLCRNQIPLYDGIEIVNRALRALPMVVLVDTTALDTAETQTEYAAAVAWKHSRPRRIDIQTNTGDSNDNDWEILHGWDYVPAGANSAGLLIFDSQPTASRDLRIWYDADHPRVSLYSDYINEMLRPEVVRATVLQEVLDFLIAKQGQSASNALKEQRNKAAVDADRALARNYIFRPPREARLNIIEW